MQKPGTGHHYVKTVPLPLHTCPVISSSAITDFQFLHFVRQFSREHTRTADQLHYLAHRVVSKISQMTLNSFSDVMYATATSGRLPKCINVMKSINMQEVYRIKREIERKKCIRYSGGLPNKADAHLAVNQNNNSAENHSE